ncbi:YokU family protein [Alkalihalobacillus sp. AL-G]|uniref:YokU family protein n=1 Tax=Alkalihalobacillus sp. AL-G TaxID=2926399 RepID=UPI0027299752|nr:YokU family protein [Alkalihalobacillus sp. AL-G]WLD91501.1 YokU family protein [Alkalihalobacillus sp. AL-G]
MECMWCDSTHAKESAKTCYWELPDGTRAIEITEMPSVACPDCGMEYQVESLIEEIEDQLMLINTKLLPNSIPFSELMAQPRLLQRNYFKF